MRKLIIGITGTFGSGKTTVARMIKKRNAIVIDADRLAKRMSKRNEIKDKTLRAFGTTSRKKLAEIVFADEKKLRKLNSILHPLLKKEIKRIITKIKKKIIVIDAALLVEARFLDLLDCLILVRCNNKARIRRLLKKGFRGREIAARTRFQLSDAKKRKYADFVIDNSGTKKETEKQVERIWKSIISR